MLKPLAAVLALAATSAASAETYAIQAGPLIVDAAQAVRGASTVTVENGWIARIEDGFTAPTGATAIDQRGRTHVHLTGNSKSADLIAADGDPLTDPTAVQRVGYVMVKGRPIPM